jgi:RNA polymerase sigma factor (sigma-70 family)
LLGTRCVAGGFGRTSKPRCRWSIPTPGQLERLQAEHTSKEVRTGLARLPDRARMALVLRYFADMSYEEIADTLGVRRRS